MSNNEIALTDRAAEHVKSYLAKKRCRGRPAGSG